MLKIEVIGNLGNDAESVDYQGRRFTSFSVAHSDRFTDASGQQREVTTWVRCTKNGDNATLMPYLKKGTQVYIRGNMTVGTYQSRQTGTTNVEVKCSVTEIQLLSRPVRQDGQAVPAAAPGYTAQPAAAPGGFATPPAMMPMDENDDLPFDNR